MRKKPKDAGVQRPDLLQVRLASYLKPVSAAHELGKTKILDLLDPGDRARLEQVVQALDRGRGVEVLTLDVMFQLRNNRSKPARVQVALKQATPATVTGCLLFKIRKRTGKSRA
jgi:diguanylate cyclase